MKCRIPANDLTQKLDSTICRYKGVPYWVRVNSGALDLYQLPGMKKKIITIQPDDDDFDIASPSLGYVQYDNKIVGYLSRAPIRRTRQGLDSRSIKIRLNNGSPKLNYSLNVNNFIGSQGFVDMIMNKYPPLDACIKQLRGMWRSDPEMMPQVAVNRNVSLTIDQMGIIKVFYKTEYVGWIEPDKFIVHTRRSDDMGWVVSKYLSHELSWEVD